jgi:hypothetical protein
MARSRILWISIVVTLTMATTALATRLPGAARDFSACTLYASPRGTDSATLLGQRERNGRGAPGSAMNPFATPQRLLQSLQPGQTGCLHRGTYNGEVRFNNGGQPGAPITLRSLPGQRATLAGGYVYVPTGSNYVTLENLNVNSVGTTQVSVQIFGSEVSLIGNNITNHAQHNSCIIMGYPGYTPYPTNTLIENNVIHQCGNRADGNQDHAIYFSQSIDATVTNNVIWGTAAFALHLYPDAQGNQVTHNVIDGNGYGAIFGGNSDSTSNDNNVSYNVITDSGDGYDVQSAWVGAVGSGNVVHGNCMSNDRRRDIQRPTTGFTADGNIFARPRFANPARHDFALRARSRCLGVIGADSERLLREVWKRR